MIRRILGLTKRNILVYIKDKATVLFSMLTPIILFCMYIFFLRGNIVSGVNSAAGELLPLIGEKDINQFVNAFLLVSIMGSALVTVPYNCLITLVRDKENKVDNDISSTPMKRWEIVISYFLSSATCAVLMTSLILGAGLIILSVMGDLYISFAGLCKVFGLVMMGAASATALFMVVVQFFRSSSASGAFMGILSAGIGFIIGAYIPLSEFSATVRNICFLFPATLITGLLKENLLGGLLSHMNDSIGGLDGGMFKEGIEGAFDFKAYVGGKMWVQSEEILYIIGVAIVSIVLICIIYPKINKRK